MAIGSAMTGDGLDDPAELAQLNVARLIAPLGSPEVAEFVAGLVPINRLAERSPGFVWRHPSAHDGAPVLAAGDERLIVNLSTWRTYEDLHQFVYRTALGGYVRRRLRWFVQPSGPTIVLWWVWSGHRPSTEEAFVRLEHLRARGPTARAFTPLRRFDPDGSPAFTWPRARRHQRTHPRTGLPGAMPFCIVLARINVVVRSCRSALAQAPEGVRLFLSASFWASRACWLCSSSPRPHLSSWRPSVARPCLLRAR